MILSGREEWRENKGERPTTKGAPPRTATTIHHGLRQAQTLREARRAQRTANRHNTSRGGGGVRGCGVVGRKVEEGAGLEGGGSRKGAKNTKKHVRRLRSGCRSPRSPVRRDRHPRSGCSLRVFRDDRRPSSLPRLHPDPLAAPGSRSPNSRRTRSFEVEGTK